ncbi:MAG: hypothetical protein JWN32_4283 [Solirubrobacterales bacterium]|nr:hypothetical protein [Solirubrobacterales bacterium]
MLPVRRRRQTVTSLVLIVALGIPSSARADRGVYPDPGSPAAKEYAVPLDSARGVGGAPSVVRSGPSAGAPIPAPLFGAGVRPAARPTKPAVRHRTRTGSKSTPTPTAPPATASAAHVPAPNAVGGQGSGVAWLAGLGGAVLALGALGGALGSRKQGYPRAKTSKLGLRRP